MKKIGWAACTRLMRAMFFTLTIVPALGANTIQAADETPAATSEQPDPEAKAIFFKMANFIAQAPALSVTVRSGYDAIQADGQRIEFGEKRRMLLQRPDRLRFNATRSDGEQALFLFDGKAITAFKAADNVYARVEKSGTVDDIIVYLAGDLQVTLPLARMFRSDFPQEMEKRITSIEYVEENHLFDVLTDHLALRSEEVDLQVWIAQGEQPLPARVIITYKNEPGQPQFRADLSEWNVSPEVAADSFSFSPPAGAEQIPFLAPQRQKGSLPVQRGEEQ